LQWTIRVERTSKFYGVRGRNAIEPKSGVLGSGKVLCRVDAFRRPASLLFWGSVVMSDGSLRGRSAQEISGFEIALGMFVLMLLFSRQAMAMSNLPCDAGTARS